MHNTDIKIKILSIDGGGIRGIIPATFLSKLEERLQQQQRGRQLWQEFDLICGTSTGAIIAIGLALGVPAKDILAFYKNYARDIFPNWPFNIDKIKAVIKPYYSNKKLSRALEEVYSKTTNGNTALLNDAKTNLCIPTFNGGEGEINVLKTKHHEGYHKDFMIPAHHAALASASAPVYFPPHSFKFSNEFGNGTYINMVDGGLFANNPSLIGLLEATDKLGFDFNEIALLSLGTGEGRHILKRRWKPPGIRYWLFPEPKLMDITLDSQAQMTEHYLAFLNRALQKKGNAITYERVQYQFSEKPIQLNTSSRKDIERLEVIGEELSKKNLIKIFDTFINKK